MACQTFLDKMYLLSIVKFAIFLYIYIMILKAYKYRLNPTPNQQILLDKHIGACRFVYNLAFETKQTAYNGKQINLSCFDLIKQLPELKQECDWLKEINSQSLQASIKHLDIAYTSFFKGIGKFPKYKSKSKSKKSFNIPQGVEIINDRLCIPKFKKGIKLVQHRSFEGIIKQATISKTPTDKYFASILVETVDNIVDKKPVIKENTIGIDLGIKEFLITSLGTKIENPRFLKKSITKLKYIQKKYSKKKGKKTKHKLQKLHEKVALQRKDFLHKVSSDLVKNHDTIALETLKVKNMIKNHNLAQSISDVSWSTFVEMLEYKANWYGTNIIRIGTFEPSSKMCSNCGEINKELKLSEREWCCENCHSCHDRDINASINIKNIALKAKPTDKYLCTEDTLKNRNELPAIVGVMTYKATIPLG
jgi:putative transposase